MNNIDIRKRDGSTVSEYEINLVAYLDKLINEIAAAVEYDEPMPDHVGAKLPYKFSESNLGNLEKAVVQLGRVDLSYPLETGVTARYICRSVEHAWDNAHPEKEQWIVDDCDIEIPEGYDREDYW